MSCVSVFCPERKAVAATYTTVGMVDGVHGNTTSLGPRVALDSELVLGTRSLCKWNQQICASRAIMAPGAPGSEKKHTQERLVGTATTSNNADHATGAAVDDLLGTRGKLDAGLALIRVVADDGDVVAGGTGKGATVTNLLLDVGDDGTLGHGAQGQDVADGQSSVLAGVDELAGVHALVGDEGLGVLLELVGVLEGDLGEGSTTTGVVDDLLHDSAEVAIALSVVESSELGRGL